MLWVGLRRKDQHHQCYGWALEEKAAGVLASASDACLSQLCLQTANSHNVVQQSCLALETSTECLLIYDWCLDVC